MDTKSREPLLLTGLAKVKKKVLAYFEWIITKNIFLQSFLRIYNLYGEFGKCFYQDTNSNVYCYEFVNIACKICIYYLFLNYNISDAREIFIFGEKSRDLS